MDRCNRRQFLTESLGAGLALVPMRAAMVQAAQQAEAVRVCLVTSDAAKQWDITGVFEELGLAWEATSPAKASQITTDRFAALWITSSSYPEPSALPKELLGKLEQFLKAGKGVFAEYVSNFPAVQADDSPQRTGIARLFVANPVDLPDALPAGIILDEHDSMCLPLLKEPERSKRVLAFGRVAGVEKVVPKSQPQDTWTGLLWGERGPGRYALATTSISEFRRRQYAPLAHWSKFLRQLVTALLPEPERRKVLDRYIPVQAYTEPRVWVQPGTEVRVVVETSPNARVHLLRPATVGMTASGGGRYEGKWMAAGSGEQNLAVEVSRAGRKRSLEIPVRIAGRKAAYLRALERNIRWYERSGALLKPDGTMGVSEWISGPDIEGVRSPTGRSSCSRPSERTACFSRRWRFGCTGSWQEARGTSASRRTCSSESWTSSGWREATEGTACGIRGAGEGRHSKTTFRGRRFAPWPATATPRTGCSWSAACFQRRPRCARSGRTTGCAFLFITE